MNKLLRFGVSIESELLSQFDKLIKKEGYSSRSEAIRDLIRNSIVSESWEVGSSEVIGTITIIYDHTLSGLSDTITNIEHNFHKLIISTTHVHFDEKNCLEVVILKGDAKEIKELYEKLLILKGVKQSKLSATGII